MKTHFYFFNESLKGLIGHEMQEYTYSCPLTAIYRTQSAGIHQSMSFNCDL